MADDMFTNAVLEKVRHKTFFARLKQQTDESLKKEQGGETWLGLSEESEKQQKHV